MATATYVGKKIERLLVLTEYSALDSKGKKRYYCTCRCDCGKEIIVQKSVLYGKIKSCGCLRKELGKTYQSRLPKISTNVEITGLKRIYADYRNGAKRRSYEFSLSIKEVEELIFKPCVYCGCLPGNKFNLATNKQSVTDAVFIYQGIDRLDPSIGYTVENTVPCCIKCNKAKGKMTQKEFVFFIEMVYNNLQKGTRQ